MFAVNNNVQTQIGLDLAEIQTEGIGYQAISGETKLQLVSPWPQNALPKPTSTLLSIAPRNELLAAAGPSTLILASTSAVRDAFVADTPATNNVKSFTPQIGIEVPRLSQVTFTSDENFLVICAEEGGGLSIYDTKELKNSKTQSAFQLATNGTCVRALVPNPSPENDHVLAVVLTNGQLLLANLQERRFTHGSNGAVLKDGVSCVSWSVKGKQLVAGLGNGTAVQLDPTGAMKAEIPRPPNLDGDQHVSGISWLANDLFFAIYNPTNFEMEHVPDSTYILITRQPKTTNYTFQKMQDPVGTFGMTRCPPHHFIQRLRDYPPNLMDAILLSSTGSGDIGLITCSKTPLSSEPALAHTANSYTTTGILDDARRAQLPVYDEMNDMSGSSDTSPIGMVLDLSSRNNVKRPIPAEEIDTSSTPLPGLMVLNNEGVLSSWWLVYSESVRQGTIYPGLIVATASHVTTQVSQPQQSSSFGARSQTQSAFGAATFGAPSTFGSSATPSKLGVSSFGSLSTPGVVAGWGSSGTANHLSKPAFGASTPLGGISKPAFGSSTPLNGPSNTAFGTSSPLNTTNRPAFGSSTPLGGTVKPAFGSSTPLGATNSAFGAAGGLGKSQSPWGATTNQHVSSTATDKPNPFGGSSASSGFAALGQSNEQAFSPFSKLGTTTSSFAALGRQQPKSIFSTQSSSGNALTQSSTSSNAFGAALSDKSKSLWGPSSQESGLARGSVTNTKTAANNAADADMTSSAMEEDTPITKEKPVAKPAGSLGTAVTGFKLGSSFEGDATAKDDLLHPPDPSLFGSAFGNALSDAQDTQAAPSTPIKEEPKSPEPLNHFSNTPESPSKATVSGPPSSIPSSTKVQGGIEISQKNVQTLPKSPLPSSPKSTTTQIISEPATLPPSRESEKQYEVSSLQEESQGTFSPAGSPPIDLGQSRSSPLSSPRSLRSSDDVDDAPLPPDFVPEKPVNASEPVLKPTTPAKNFSRPDFKASPLTSPSLPKSPLPNFSTTPLYPPVSATKPPVFFQPPSNLQDSPRSPSPVRNDRQIGGVRSLLPPKHSVAVKSTIPVSQPVGQPLFRTNSQPQPYQPSFQLPKTIVQAPLEQSEPQDQFEELSDDSDEDIRRELTQPVEARRILAPFIAHQDYVGKVSGEGVPAQAEKLFRDINSMIDTLGLNAQSMSSFVKGHTELLPDEGRERADLEDDTDWCLIEIEDLIVIQKNLLEELENERPQEVKEKIEELRTILGQQAKQRKRQQEIKKLIDSDKNANIDSEGRRPELTGEQNAVLSDLRRDFSHFQKLMAEAEDATSLLKARLTSIQAQSSVASTSNKVPTVEAIVKTIFKMTRMVEEKSGDIDLLEARMRKLKFRARSSREGTPATLDEALGRLSLVSNGSNGKASSTPPGSTTNRTGSYELTYSPDSSDDEFSSLCNSLNSSQGASSRRQPHVRRITKEEIKYLAKKRVERNQFMQLLKERLCSNGVKTTD